MIKNNIKNLQPNLSQKKKINFLPWILNASTLNMKRADAIEALEAYVRSGGKKFVLGSGEGGEEIDDHRAVEIAETAQRILHRHDSNAIGIYYVRVSAGKNAAKTQHAVQTIHEAVKSQGGDCRLSGAWVRFPESVGESWDSALVDSLRGLEEARKAGHLHGVYGVESRGVLLDPSHEYHVSFERLLRSAKLAEAHHMGLLAYPCNVIERQSVELATQKYLDRPWTVRDLAKHLDWHCLGTRPLRPLLPNGDQILIGAPIPTYALSREEQKDRVKKALDELIHLEKHTPIDLKSQEEHLSWGHRIAHHSQSLDSLARLRDAVNESIRPSVDATMAELYRIHVGRNSSVLQYLMHYRSSLEHLLDVLESMLTEKNEQWLQEWLPKEDDVVEASPTLRVQSSLRWIQNSHAVDDICITCSSAEHVSSLTL